MDLQEEKWVEMKGKIVPIMKLESIAREQLDYWSGWYEFWLKLSDCPIRDSWLPRCKKWLDKTEKKFEQILFLKDSAPSLPSPCRVNLASTDGDVSHELELIPHFFFAGEKDDNSLNFELLVPSFFFEEEEDLSGNVNFQSKEVISSEVNCVKLECSKELVISYNKLMEVAGRIFSCNFKSVR
ncbi:uncharacterized protein LOC113345714 isoform X2 [Papaver somniferum]|uniref:uncharacterized protein LOC113345714 isoform X2 n=1 Tax=Papaver somniferum TaxID=3469 RepID=UPI000E6FE4DF|nr:uncharacterized protein LOC113345714 isoform X2 [Papaver somniferum]